MNATRVLVRPAHGRGQILPLTAFMMVVLVGMTALAIDVSAAFLTERWERSVADAAALAGAQSLQKPGTRLPPGPSEVSHAQEQAKRVVEAQLGGLLSGGASCYTQSGCAVAGTPYFVSIRTPSPSCVDCAMNPERAMQVSIWQPAFGLTFGRIFGESTWTVRSTSVAGAVLAPQYGIVTLRPTAPRAPSGTDANYDDLKVAGGSKVIVGNADVATNSNATCSGATSGSEIRINTAAGYNLHHYAPVPHWTSPPGNCMAPPPGFQVQSLIQDPGYAIPQRTSSTPVYANTTAGRALAKAAAADCDAQQLLVPETYRERKTSKRVNNPLEATVECYKPGIYQFTLEAKDPASGLPNAVLLLPGVYFFDAGLSVSSTLIGGYEPGRPGVALVFLEASNASGIPGQFRTNSTTSLVALNFGSRYCPGSTCTDGLFASPAEDPNGGLVQTPGDNPTLLTVMVERDPTCIVVDPAPSACDETKNKTVSLTGRGNVFLAGVQYAPSDNVVLTGGSGQSSDVGAFWAWTLEFDGGATFNLRSTNPESSGVLRLDPACSPNVSTCNP